MNLFYNNLLIKENIVLKDRYCGAYEYVILAATTTRLCLSRGSLKECSSWKVFKLRNLHYTTTLKWWKLRGKLICLQFSIFTVKRKMPTFREAREVLLYAISEYMVSDEEFALLYDINTSKNRDFEYWIYNAFNLHEISDDDCVTEFRF